MIISVFYRVWFPMGTRAKKSQWWKRWLSSIMRKSPRANLNRETLKQTLKDKRTKWKLNAKRSSKR